MGLYTKIKGPIGYTLVGSPTDNNGVISGFAAGKCAKTSENLDTTKDFELVVSAVVGTCSDSSFCTIFRNSNDSTQAGFSIGLVNYKFMYYLVDNEGTAITSGSTGSTTFTSGTSLLIKFEQKSTLIRLSFSRDNGATWTIDKSFTSNKRMGGANGVFFGGGKTSLSTQYWRGSIDLNNSYINVNNISWFGTSFSKVKVNTGLTKYTVVGNPTITSEGIASGFSSSNYLTLPRLNTQGLKKVEFGFCLINVGGQNYRQYFSMTGLSLCISHGGGVGINYSGSSYYNWNTPPSTGEVLIKSIFDIENSQLIISWTSDGQTYKTSTHQLSSITHLDSIMNIGSGGISIIEAINLKRSYIKIDDKYYWRGFDYQNINAWKIHQDNFSKYYTIVDGKLMWASPDIYLKSSTTAQNLNHYINTNYYPNNNTRVITSFDNSTRNYGIRLFGEQYSPNMFRFGTTNGTGWLFAYGSQGTSSSTINFIHERVKVDFNKNVIKINDTVINTFTEQTFTSTQPFYLMNINQSTMRDAWDAPVYWCKIYDNDILVRHFVPVPKGLLIGNFVVPSNGMFDIVEQKFYGNAGTGDFVIGGIPEEYIIEGGKLVWCNPDIYLESSGTQWISTGIDLYQATDHKLCFDFTPIQFYDYNSLFGVTTDENNWEGWIYSNGKIAARYNNTRYAADETLTVNTRNYVEYIKDNLSLKRNLNGTLSGTTTVTVPARNGIITLYHSGPDNSKLKNYSFKLYSGDILLQYLIPVPKGMLIGDKIAPSNCMFDLVTQTFFENQGTGDFIIGGISGDYINVGDNIVWTDNNVYLKCNGAQYFDSGFRANQDTKVDIDYTVNGSGTQALYCSRDNTSTSTFTMFRPYGSSSTRFDYNTSQNGISGTVSSGTRYNVIADKNKCYIDNELKYTATYANFQSNMGMIFGCSGYGGGNLGNWGYHKYHKIQLYNNTKLIRYFLPVNTNTVIGSFTVPAPGMWDAITKKFYPNKGTGNFTYGKDS